MEDDDIEVLDIFDKKPVNSTENKSKSENDENKKNDIKKESKKEEGKKKVAKKKKRRVKGQAIFCAISALFILGCLIFYGARFIKYYRIYNPKIDTDGTGALLATKLEGSEIVYEESGLYISGGNYIYKGNINNNYLKYNNMLWRIIRINKDGTILLILDDYVTLLPWNKEVSSFEKSQVYDYLNNVFAKNLDTSYLTKVNFCTDPVYNLTDVTCNNTEYGYVSLLDITNFLNSVVDDKTYLSKEEEIFWLNNPGKENIWHTNGSNASNSVSSTFYEVRPVVQLAGTTKYAGGEGTIDKPYLITKDNKVSVGSYITLGEDKWVIYDITGSNYKLMLANNINNKTYHFDNSSFDYNLESTSSLAYYLNNTYLNSLSYKDMLVEDEWNVGEYTDDIMNINEKKVKAKVGIPNILDIKFDSDIKDYFLSTKIDAERLEVYDSYFKASKPGIYKNIRPCIAISKSTKLSGEGTKDSPLVVEG